MRRLFLLLTPFLLLALVACGGSQKTSSGAAPTVEPRTLAEASGRVSAEQPVTVQPASVVGQPDNPADGLALIDVTTTVGTDGTVLVSGKVINRGQGAAKTTSIAVDVVDSSGKSVMRQQFAYPRLPTIRPGDEVTWQGQTQFKLTDGQRVQVAVAGEPTEK